MISYRGSFGMTHLVFTSQELQLENEQMAIEPSSNQRHLLRCESRKQMHSWWSHPKARLLHFSNAPILLEHALLCFLFQNQQQIFNCKEERWNATDEIFDNNWLTVMCSLFFMTWQTKICKSLSWHCPKCHGIAFSDEQIFKKLLLLRKASEEPCHHWDFDGVCASMTCLPWFLWPQVLLNHFWKICASALFLHDKNEKKQLTHWRGCETMLSACTFLMCVHSKLRHNQCWMKIAREVLSNHEHKHVVVQLPTAPKHHWHGATVTLVAWSLPEDFWKKSLRLNSSQWVDFQATTLWRHGAIVPAVKLCLQAHHDGLKKASLHFRWSHSCSSHWADHWTSETHFKCHDCADATIFVLEGWPPWAQNNILMPDSSNLQNITSFWIFPKFLVWAQHVFSKTSIALFAWSQTNNEWGLVACCRDQSMQASKVSCCAWVQWKHQRLWLIVLSDTFIQKWFLFLCNLLWNCCSDWFHLVMDHANKGETKQKTWQQRRLFQRATLFCQFERATTFWLSWISWFLTWRQRMPAGNFRCFHCSGSSQEGKSKAWLKSGEWVVAFHWKVCLDCIAKRLEAFDDSEVCCFFFVQQFSLTHWSLRQFQTRSGCCLLSSQKSQKEERRQCFFPLDAFSRIGLKILAISHHCGAWNNFCLVCFSTS